ncbi:MAG TPA: DNA-processing protein DprA [Candidatus Limnocylindrales bacterium]|nr:DNA-processing protein DprA [Candidatus Limnocylindrales bacterium]
MTEREAWAILLSVTGLGPVGFAALLRSFGTARRVLAAARRPNAGARLAAAGTSDGRRTFDRPVADAIGDLARDPSTRLAALRAAGTTILTLDDEAYPDRLRHIELPPPVLYVRGRLEVLATHRLVAVVGTRRPTGQGRALAARIGAAIARAGGGVVSGLAVGIDGSAHAAVVHESGPTIGVLGSGHLRLYPRVHAGLAEKILAAGGSIVSELFPDTKPSPDSFPRRNRLISGLADATIVVEAGERSGALITAGWALEQGRPCFMVPGSVDSPQSAGCRRWLREYPDEVRIVAGIPELVHDLGLGGRTGHLAVAGRPTLEAELIELGAAARSVATELVRGRTTLDELVSATGHEVATALGALTLLEMRGLATGAYGRYRPAGRLASADPPRAPAA